MAEKTLGYVELEWTCTRCGTVNPGTQKTCSNCGAAMGDQEKFELPTQQTLVTGDEALAKAAQGPDVHCPYCGTRNLASAQVCTQCGGDLKDAQARQKGQVMGAYSSAQASDIRCPSCGTPNPPGSARCKTCGGGLATVREAAPVVPAAAKPAGKAGSRLMIIVIAIVAVLCLGGVLLVLLSLRTEEQAGVVRSVQWERRVEITEQRPVEHEDWKDEIPSGAEIGTCQQEYHTTQLEPAPGAEEVCGTPYTVDQGSGVAKVVQECEYRIYDDWCTYTQLDWVVVETPRLQGEDLNPQWPAISLSQDQREGNRLEEYQVVFHSGDEIYTYSVDSPEEFTQFTPGSQWMLEVNTFGAVTGVQEK